MFDQFDDKSSGRETGKRFGASLAVSCVVYGLLATGVVVISATVGTVVREENLRQVIFAPPPRPKVVQPPPAPPPPPPPPPVAKRRPASKRRAVQRNEMAAPDAIPDERPEEADGPLVDAEPTGPIDGFLDGGGTKRVAAPAPPPPPSPPPRRVIAPVYTVERASAPVPLRANRSPEYPDEARRSGIQGVVTVRIIVLPSGRVGTVDILRGPEIFHDAVRSAIRSWRFSPARLEGRPVAVRRVVRIPFRLENVERA